MRQDTINSVLESIEKKAEDISNFNRLNLKTKNIAIARAIDSNAICSQIKCNINTTDSIYKGSLLIGFILYFELKPDKGKYYLAYAIALLVELERNNNNNINFDNVLNNLRTIKPKINQCNIALETKTGLAIGMGTQTKVKELKIIIDSILESLK